MRHVYLSYPMAPTMPVYGGSGVALVEKVRDLDCGDVAAVVRLTFENHWGTHVDGVAHFFKGGKPICDYSPDFWIFNAPVVVLLTLQEGQIVSVDDVCPNVPADADLILLRSGWSQKRGQEAYSKRGPGVSPKLGEALRAQFPKVRAIGMDWVSASSYLNRALGHEAHWAFLDPKTAGHPIHFVEDMDLSNLPEKLRQVLIFPLRFEGIDSAPCTVVGVCDD